MRASVFETTDSEILRRDKYMEKWDPIPYHWSDTHYAGPFDFAFYENDANNLNSGKVYLQAAMYDVYPASE